MYTVQLRYKYKSIYAQDEIIGYQYHSVVAITEDFRLKSQNINACMSKFEFKFCFSPIKLLL